MSKILGIDLGTTNSAMAVTEGGEPRILENKEGNRTTSSMVAVNKNGERLAGLLAKRQAVTNPYNTIYSVKRLIGRRFSDEEVQRDKKLLPYEIREAKDGGVDVKMGEKWHTPAEISAMILQKMKADAEDRLGEKIEAAVITVPAYFDDAQRKATKDAGTIAGFDVKRIINEPTAAALAYGFQKKKDEKVVVFDFGGGTFDVSVLEVSADTVEVRSTGGNTHLGGDDFDQQIIDWIIDEFKKDQGIDLGEDQLALQRLKEAAEKAKHELSSSSETDVNIPFVTTDDAGPKHLDMKLSRSKLEELVMSDVEKSIQITKDVVKDAKFDIKEIDEVILVGGQTRMPLIQEKVKELFGKEPHKDINPDEVVADGAAVQAGILQGDVKDVLLLDVTPLSFSIETLGGVATPLIERNTTIPAAKSQIFSTAADSQTSVEVHVVQGERSMAHDNKSLGRFILDGIPPSPRGIPQIEVSFDIDANGILNVTAKDKATNKEQSIRIEASSGLSDEDIEKMRKDAESHAADDKKKKDLIDVRNQADTLLYSTEKALKEAGDKVDEKDKKPVEEKMEELKGVKESDDVEAIKKKLEELSGAVQAIGTQLYQAAQDAAKKEGEGGDSPEENSTVEDAEVEESDDDNEKEEEKNEKEEEKDEDGDK